MVASTRSRGKPGWSRSFSTRALIPGRASANATIDLIEAKPGLFFDPLNQVDFRVSKTFVVKGTRIQGLFDAYNLLNANTVLTLNTSYGTDGANWLRPTAALPGRLVRFGVQIKF